MEQTADLVVTSIVGAYAGNEKSGQLTFCFIGGARPGSTTAVLRSAWPIYHECTYPALGHTCACLHSPPPAGHYSRWRRSSWISRWLRSTSRGSVPIQTVPTIPSPPAPKSRDRARLQFLPPRDRNVTIRASSGTRWMPSGTVVHVVDGVERTHLFRRIESIGIRPGPDEPRHGARDNSASDGDRDRHRATNPRRDRSRPTSTSPSTRLHPERTVAAEWLTRWVVNPVPQR